MHTVPRDYLKLGYINYGYLWILIFTWLDTVYTSRCAIIFILLKIISSDFYTQIRSIIRKYKTQQVIILFYGINTIYYMSKNSNITNFTGVDEQRRKHQDPANKHNTKKWKFILPPNFKQSETWSSRNLKRISTHELYYRLNKSDSSLLEKSRGFAFSWKTTRESFQITAIVVDHEVFLNPSQSSSSMCIKLVGLPCWIREWIGRRESGNIEVPVVCCKGCLSPICFHQSSSCSPIISIPKARVNLHRLSLREWNTNRFCVLEYSYGSVINQEAEKG